MKRLLLLCFSASLYAGDVPPKKEKIPPPPSNRKHVPGGARKKEKLAEIRAILNATLGKQQ